MNGNDMVIIEEKHIQQIFEDWTTTLTTDDIPQDFITKWVDSYLEGNQ